jgi:26S proteasome regulatory subunit N1
MAHDSETSKSMDKGKGKAIDSETTKGKDAKKDKDAKPLVNGEEEPVIGGMFYAARQELMTSN